MLAPQPLGSRAWEQRKDIGAELDGMVPIAVRGILRKVSEGDNLHEMGHLFRRDEARKEQQARGLENRMMEFGSKWPPTMATLLMPHPSASRASKPLAARAVVTLARVAPLNLTITRL